MLGFDHAQIGAALAARWKFPAEIAAAISGHHSLPAQSGQVGAQVALVDLVHVADVLAHALEFSGDENDLVPPLSAVSWQRLGLAWGELPRLLGAIDAQRGDAEMLLE